MTHTRTHRSNAFLTTTAMTAVMFGIAWMAAGCAGRASSDWAQVSPAQAPNGQEQTVALAAWEGAVGLDRDQQVEHIASADANAAP